MTIFVLGAAGLLALAAWLLMPAWRSVRTPVEAQPAHVVILREQLVALDRDRDTGELDAEQHRLARIELQHRLLDDSATGRPVIDNRPVGAWLYALMIALPLFSVALYAALGNPEGWTVRPGTVPPTARTEPTSEVAPEALNEMLTTLAQRLEKPSGNADNDLQGWTMLARAYAGMQRFAEAERAFGRAIALAPKDAQLLADRADVLAVLQEGRASGEPERLIAQALQLDPNNVKALALSGSVAYERRDFAAARQQWQKARDLTPPGSAFAAGLDRSLSEVAATRTDTSTQTSPETLPETSTGAPFATPARITGRVSLAPALAARVAPGDTVFVFARAADGPRMPLAIVRRTVADLPFDFTLDDGSAMSPQMKLSGASRVVVGARISRSGSATPQPGDMRGESAAIAPRARDLRLSIDTVEP